MNLTIKNILISKAKKLWPKSMGLKPKKIDKKMELGDRIKKKYNKSMDKIKYI